MHVYVRELLFQYVKEHRDFCFAMQRYNIKKSPATYCCRGFCLKE